MDTTIPEKINFPKEEEEILKYWDEIKAFEFTENNKEGRKEFSFYDGPPFATGLPHYGHLLAGTIKDTVCRYAYMDGYHVSRRFGWDTHGLPIEFEIDKVLGIKSSDEVLKFGIPNYNRECRNIVMRFSEEWKKVVHRCGRWIDMDHPYKTMDKEFMESVWWVCKQLFEKKLIYRGLKIMPFSTACCTPLSNFEANMDYRDVKDPAITITFPVVGEEGNSFLAWTTTPWTLPSNLALCVNANMDYVLFHDEQTNHNYYMMKALMKDLPNAKKAKRTILKELKGKELVGKRYVPLFNYFASKSDKFFQVLADDYVKDDSGTGIVHQAPGFGEDDYRVCMTNGLISKGTDLVCPVDHSGKFTKEVPDYEGIYIKDADKTIIERLKKEGRIFNVGSITHSYPFCWRSGTPLIYKAVPSWFVSVESFRDKLVENSKTTYWVPENIREGRFQNWLENARDWAISRNRFWGTPIPIWADESFEHLLCIGSIEELQQYTDKKITDLHRENIDDIVIEKDGIKYTRIPEVFDCWFESGSMPYGQMHYPFENKDKFEKSFPADFIAEGIDQTRGWFYSLLVLSTALFDKAPFKNLVVNGLLLAEDGKKMSKRLKNYPDPTDMLNVYGADALRLALINSPAVRAETIRFKESTMKELTSSIFLPWFNTLRYLKQSFKSFMKVPKITEIKDLNVLDKWILSTLMTLCKKVKEEMKFYRLYNVIPPLVEFLTTLSNWYIRLNRKRFRGSYGQESQATSCYVLYYCLLYMSKMMAPFTPFFSEFVYQKLKAFDVVEKETEKSVHFCSLPQVYEEFFDIKLEQVVSSLQKIIELGRAARDRRTLPLKQPLNKITIIHSDKSFLDAIMELKEYILVELNLNEVEITTNQDEFIKLTLQPDRSKIGKKYRKEASKYVTAIQGMGRDDILKFMNDGKIEIMGQTFTSEEITVYREFIGDTKENEAMWDKDVLILLDVVRNSALIEKGLIREINNRIQKLRKKASLKVDDRITVYYKFDDDKHEGIETAIKNQQEFIKSLDVVLVPFVEGKEIIADEQCVMKSCPESIHLYLSWTN